jgi:hypothetical protein
MMRAVPVICLALAAAIASSAIPAASSFAQTNPSLEQNWASHGSYMRAAHPGSKGVRHAGMAEAAHSPSAGHNRPGHGGLGGLGHGGLGHGGLGHAGGGRGRGGGGHGGRGR